MQVGRIWMIVNQNKIFIEAIKFCLICEISDILLMRSNEFMHIHTKMSTKSTRFSRFRSTFQHVLVILYETFLSCCTHVQL